MFKQETLVHEINNLRKFALRLTRNTTDASDLVQATLLRALEKSDYFEEGTNLFSWTSKIMFNIFVSQYRHSRKFDSQYDPEPHIMQMSVAPTQEHAVDLATVRRGISELCPDHRQILTLVCIRGMRYEEVSEMLRIPVGTVRSRLSRARKSLQDNLEMPHYMMGLPAEQKRKYLH